MVWRRKRTPYLSNVSATPLPSPDAASAAGIGDVGVPRRISTSRSCRSDSYGSAASAPTHATSTLVRPVGSSPAPIGMRPVYRTGASSRGGSGNVTGSNARSGTRSSAASSVCEQLVERDVAPRQEVRVGGW